VIGTFEDKDPTPTLELALRLHPDVSRIVLVRGASELDRRWDARIRGAVERLGSRVSVQYLSGLPTSEVLSRVAALPQGTIAFTPGYFNDGAGNVTTPRQSIQRIAEASAVPVYGAFDTQLGTGIVGGYMNRYENQAREAGAMVVKLLDGAAPAQLGSTSTKRVAMVDWRQLKRWNVDERLLPEGTVVSFREPLRLGEVRAGDRDRHRRRARASRADRGTAAPACAPPPAEHASSMLAGRLMTAHEDERRRMARDLHDDVTQRLARLAIDAGRLEKRRKAAAQPRGRCARSSFALSEDVHTLAYQLHPVGAGRPGTRRRNSGRVPPPFAPDLDSGERRCRERSAEGPRETSLCLFRVAQEALRNAVRHASARAIAVSLAPRGRGLELVVRDDGKGFDTEAMQTSPSLGQVSMRERVRLLAGRLDVQSELGRGTKVVAWVPLEDGVS
jgi:signal transduction histidine kinase